MTGMINASSRQRWLGPPNPALTGCPPKMNARKTKTMLLQAAVMIRPVRACPMVTERMQSVDQPRGSARLRG